MHVRSSSGSTYSPMAVDHPVPVEFELDNFKGRCIFMHRPTWTYDNPASPELYPYRSLFHNRKRLWEWRIQGKFIRRPGVLYVGIELEEYVPVNFATRALMRGILPLVQAALQCKTVQHEVGDPNEPELRPTVVAPMWAADNTLIHVDSSEAPDIAAPDLPTGLSRKGSRAYWEAMWKGDEHLDWDGDDGPTYTFALWGPSQLLDLRAWVFRKLPLMWGRDLAMEPFCGKQPVHAVVYELADGQLSRKHYQSEKTYCCDVRLCPAALWASRAFGDEGSPVKGGSYADDDAASFCSALSGDSPEPDQEESLLAVDPPATASAVITSLTSSRGRRSKLSQLLRCLRCKKRRSSSERCPNTIRGDQMI